MATPQPISDGQADMKAAANKRRTDSPLISSPKRRRTFEELQQYSSRTSSGAGMGLSTILQLLVDLPTGSKSYLKLGDQVAAQTLPSIEETRTTAIELAGAAAEALDIFTKRYKNAADRHYFKKLLDEQEEAEELMWALEAHSEAQEEIQTKLSRRLAVMEANEGTAPSTLHDRSDGAEPSSEGHNSRLAEGSEEGEISETDERRPVAAGATGLLKNTPLDGGSQQQMRPPTLAQDELQKRRSLTPSVQAPTAQPGGRRHSSLPVAPGTHGELRDALISRPAPGLFDGTGLPPAVKANNMQLARIGSFGRLADKVKTEEPTIDTGNEASNKCATQIGRSQRELEAVARVSPFYQQHFTLEMAQVTFMNAGSPCVSLFTGCVQINNSNRKATVSSIMMFYKARQLLMKKWSYRTKVPSMGPAPTLDCSEEPFWSRMSNVSRPGESSSWPSNKVEDWLESKLEPFCIYNRIFFPELWTCSFMKRERNIAQGKYRAEWESHKQEYRQLVHVRGVPTVVTAKTPLELQQKVGEITGTNGPAFAASTALAPANAPTGPSASMIPRDSRLGLGARYGGLVRRNSVGEGQRVDKQH